MSGRLPSLNGLRAFEAAASCDVFLAIGSSLTVQPAAGTCGVAVDAGAKLVKSVADAARSISRNRLP